MKRKLAIMFGLLLVMGATLPISAGPALAADHNPVYLALGDSLAVGVGATPQQLMGYVPLFHQYLKLTDDPDIALTNLGNSGETSSTFITGGQLGTAVAAIANPATDTEIVTLDIGANDLFLPMLTDPACDPSHPFFPGSCQAVLAGALGGFAGNYVAILGAINQAMLNSGDFANVMVMTYYNPLDGTRNALEGLVDQALLGFDGEINCSVNANPINVGLNDIIACLGTTFGATVVDVHPLFDGKALTLTHIGQIRANPIFSIHPKNIGHAVITGAFINELP